MIILDTNVISTLMQREPTRQVLSWLDEQPAEELWLTSVTVFEIRYGLALLPSSKRRRALDEAFTRTLEDDFDGRVLPFEVESARQAAEFAAHRRLAGRPIEFRDVEIAGIAASREASLATRNTRDFEGLGLDLVDPWTG